MACEPPRSSSAVSMFVPDIQPKATNYVMVEYLLSGHTSQSLISKATTKSSMLLSIFVSNICWGVFQNSRILALRDAALQIHRNDILKFVYQQRCMAMRRLCQIEMSACPVYSIPLSMRSLVDTCFVPPVQELLVDYRVPTLSRYWSARLMMTPSVDVSLAL
jgi:hypothetical protein